MMEPASSAAHAGYPAGRPHSSDEPSDLAAQWRKALLPTDATLQQAVHCLNESALQIALIVTSGGSLVGTLTDGDIRRGLLRGLHLQSPIDTIVQRDPLVVPPELGRAMVLQIMKANRIRQLPIIDEDRLVVGLHLWDELMAPKQRSNMMIIMAGGRGRRLYPHTDKCPKPMLPVAGRPMLEHIIERARAEGFQHFVLAVHYLGHMIQEYFGDGNRWQVNIEYIREETPLGTAGAIGLLGSRPDSAFVVSNGDVLTDIRYGELLDFHCRHEAVATMAVRMHEFQHPFGVVRLNGVDIEGFEEKPISRSHINAGIYVLEPVALELLNSRTPCDMPTLFSRLQQRSLRTIAYPMYEPWLDVGRPVDYTSAQATIRGVSE
ncbi:MAG: nucleotidyltransferase family protein [Steroidobacteraceae bacterium]|jgi:dTDP-glucose pyrophosphorylase